LKQAKGGGLVRKKEAAFQGGVRGKSEKKTKQHPKTNWTSRGGRIKIMGHSPMRTWDSEGHGGDTSGKKKKKKKRKEKKKGSIKPRELSQLRRGIHRNRNKRVVGRIAEWGLKCALNQYRRGKVDYRVKRSRPGLGTRQLWG